MEPFSFLARAGFDLVRDGVQRARRVRIRTHGAVFAGSNDLRVLATVPPVVRLALLAWVVVPVVLAAAACGGSERQATPVPQPETTANLADEPCSAVEVETLVREFVRAFNEGDPLRLGALFAPAEDFQWYSTQAPGERIKEESENRSTLLAYFEERHRAGERLRLRSVRFGGNSDGFGNFEYQLVRSAADLPATEYEGKGAAYCFDDRPDVIFVWSMGRA